MSQAQAVPIKRSLYHGRANPEVVRPFEKKTKFEGVIARPKDLNGSKPPYSPAMQSFVEDIDNSPRMRSLFKDLFLQVNTDRKWVDPDYVVKSLDDFLSLLDVVIQKPPAYYEAKREDGTIIGEIVGVPMYLVFDTLSNTPAGYDLFRMDEFNRSLETLLNAWGKYLSGPGSTATLHSGPGGWFSPAALTALERCTKSLSFNQTYVCPNPEAEARGFPSYDAFFTRELQPTARPVRFPDDNNFIHNACESSTLRIATNVQLHDQFWLKTQRYSLYDMLGSQEDALPFVGGTVYQAFLSALDYHRWHSPVKGVVTKAVVIPGTYFAVLPDDGAPEGDPELKPGDPHSAIVRSQSWLTASATRGLVFIQADNPDIGLMCFMAIGMLEVSTCEFTVKAGDKVEIGEQLGMFHFGGSSHALIFGPRATIRFETYEEGHQEPIKLGTHHWVKSIIGRIVKE